MSDTPREVKKLRPHQEEALAKFKNGSVVAGGVGSGKTLVSLAYYVQNVCGGDLVDWTVPMKHPKPLVVITTAKKRDDYDWVHEAFNFGLSQNPELSYARGQAFIVDSWNNIGKYVNESNTFFIFDEQRAVGAGKWAQSLIKIAKGEGNEWIMLSATPADTWGDYIPLFLAHGFYRNRTHFLEEHAVWRFNGKYRDIKGYVGARHLRALRDSILVEMPVERHTVRHLETVYVEHDGQLFEKVWKKRWNVYDDVPLIDAAEMHRVGRKVVNSDPDRLVKVRKLMEKHPRLIVFYTFDYELEMLRTLAHQPECEPFWSVDGVGYVSNEKYRERYAGMPGSEMGWKCGQNQGCRDVTVAEWNGHKHDKVPETDSWVYLVQYSAGSEGWNCTTTDAIIFWSLTYSHKQFEQAQGRIDRLDTPFIDLWYYILMSESRIDKLIWRALSLKKNFHEGRNIKFTPAA